MKKLTPVQQLGIAMLQRDPNIPADQKQEYSCIYQANIDNCCLDCPLYIGGDCPIPDEIDEIFRVSSVYESEGEE